jgi:hypothetical protein
LASTAGARRHLARLHHIIQAAFGWLNYHLHQYIADKRYCGDLDPEFADDLPPMTDERDVTLRDIVEAKEIVYEYDCRRRLEARHRVRERGDRAGGRGEIPRLYGRRPVPPTRGLWRDVGV